MSAPALPSFLPDSSYKITAPPDPSWSIGDKVNHNLLGAEWVSNEEKGWTVIDTSKEQPGRVYSLMISGIIPRPIAFTSTVSPDGIHNLAPFSWFNMVSANPPLVLISCTNGPIRVHDTTTNIRATKEFTVNIISEPFVQQANLTAVDAPEGHSEWAASGLTKAPSISVRPPRVQESAFSMECTLHHIYDIKPPGVDIITSTVIFGHVKHIHVRNDVITENGVVDPKVFRPVSRLGDITYSRLGDGFQLPREKWQDIGETILAVERQNQTKGELAN